MVAQQASGPLVAIMLFAWLPFITVTYTLLPPRRAAIACYIIAWLFLPVASYDVPLLPTYTKMTATSWGVLLATLLLDTQRLSRFRPKWADAFMVGYCGVQALSSLTNGLGPYDAVSDLSSTVLVWGVPYFIGRIYCNDLQGLRELAIGIVIGGALYAPLCLFEVRMSPQLHSMIYGFHQHDWLQTVRYGGWRPTVFMQHGLMVGMWMSVSSVLALWLWQQGGMRRVQGFPTLPLLVLLIVTTFLVKSTGAMALLVIGAAALYATKFFRHHWPITGLAVFVAFYITVRALGLWSGELLVDTATVIFGEERASSLVYRIENEEALSRHARQRPIFGWGGHGRNRITDAAGNYLATDSMWIVTFGTEGLVGMYTQFGLILAGAVVLARRVHPRMWTHPMVAPAVGLTAVMALYAFDSIFNYMYNPILTIAAGGLIGLDPVQFRRRRE